MKILGITAVAGGLMLAGASSVIDPVWQLGVALGAVIALLGGVAVLEDGERT